ncbi:MAG: epoxyqueuosine reductase QueH [Oscillospiraceae bacterium]|nr:epoxyqueuosine reductase QueH [Oscillospiraceae bacterium]
MMICNDNQKKKLLLHSCCAVCSSHVISVLAPEYELSVFYYNPNIWPREEYEHRKSEQIRLLNEADFCRGVSYYDLDYDHSEYLSFVKGLEKEPENGARCSECFRLRLEKTARFAKENGFDCFCTTLTVSPHKNSSVINSIGLQVSESTGIEWLHSDFKKKDGYLHSTRLAKEYGLYRQDFCGCEFAWRGKGGSL